MWTGKVWYVYEMKKYEFDLSFDIPVSYPATSPELALPELDGKTSKMYRGGKICLTVLPCRSCQPAHARTHSHASGVTVRLQRGVREREREREKPPVRS